MYQALASLLKEPQILIKKLVSNNQFAKFIVVGGLNTAFGYLIFCLFTFLSGNAYVSVVLSTIAGVLFNFKTYGSLVFNSKDHSRVFRFSAAYAFIIAIQMLFLKWLGHLGIVNPYLAVAVMVLPMAALSFVLMRKFVFHTSLILESGETSLQKKAK